MQAADRAKGARRNHEKSMNNHLHIYEPARHTMRETEHRAAERRLAAALRPSRRVRYQQVLARSRWAAAGGGCPPARRRHHNHNHPHRRPIDPADGQLIPNKTHQGEQP
jgi:hypothetical protein